MSRFKTAAVMLFLLGDPMQRIDFDSSVTTLGTIKGKPIQAQYEHKVVKQVAGNLATRTISGRVYRDSFGRTRKEIRLELAPKVVLDLAYIYDPVAKRSYILNITNRTVTEESFRSMDEILPSDVPKIMQERAFGRRTESLGEKDIGGIKCRGYRIQTAVDVELEYWLSNDLLDVILEKKTSAGEESTRLLFNINHSEPAEDLFSIPHGYSTNSSR